LNIKQAELSAHFCAGLGSRIAQCVLFNNSTAPDLSENRQFAWIRS